jgi:hypothetical protein
VGVARLLLGELLLILTQKLTGLCVKGDNSLIKFTAALNLAADYVV